MIINDDILKWCGEYKGEKFHAILCDPPYHLTSITERFGKTDSAPAKFGTDGVFQRSSKGFMGKEWDGGDIAFRKETWIALAEHLYDGAFIMAFASSRGFHRMAVAMEDAGLIAHPFIGWVYGSGFPKATRIDTQIQAKSEQEIVGKKQHSPDFSEALKGKVGYLQDPANSNNEKCFGYGEETLTTPTNPLAKAFVGHRYGLQALKPALEPILVFQKPYKGKPIDCITESGAGCLNIDGGRIGTDKIVSIPSIMKNNDKYAQDIWTKNNPIGEYKENIGRWPANIVLGHTPECRQVGVKTVGEGKLGGYNYKGEEDQVEGFVKSCKLEAQSNRGVETITEWECPDYCPVRRLGEQSGERDAGKSNNNALVGEPPKGVVPLRRGNLIPRDDIGTASRFFYNTDWELEQSDPFFYSPKASRSERDAGLDGDVKDIPYADYRENFADTDSYVTKYPDGRDRPMNKPKNNHPTVKPIKLAQHLATLLLPPKEYAPRRLLVPFAGVGSEMIGALLVGWEEVVGIEMDTEYCRIAEERIRYWSTQSTVKPTNNQGVMELGL